MSEALAHNRDLRGAVARLDAAAASAQLAGADLWPQVGAGLNATRSKQVFVGLPIPGGPASTTFSTYGVSLDVAWELDLWGKLRARRHAGAADFRAAEADPHSGRLRRRDQRDCGCTRTGNPRAPNGARYA